MSSIREVMTDASWLAHRYDPGHDAFHLVKVARDRRALVPFLTDDHIKPDPPLIFRRADVMAQPLTTGPVHFIFHSAYCCSTLLAAALDQSGVATALKEPVLLNDLVGWRHRGGADMGQVAHDSLSILSRPFLAGEAVVIKPSNVVNPLIPALMQLRPAARAILLHAPIETYLTSIARKGMWGRLWVRDLLVKLMTDRMIDGLGIGPDDLLKLTDLQVAAVGWLAQHRLFQAMARQLSGRVATLNSETLIARPSESLLATARLFDLPMDEREAAAIATGPIFARDAKSGDTFGKGQRAADAREGLSVHGDEIVKVAVWAKAVADNAAISTALPAALLS